MRVAPDELFVDVAGHVIEIELPRLLGEQRMKNDLDQHVAQLLAHVREVIPVNRLQQLAALVDQAAGEALVGLLLVPGAAVSAAQPGHGVPQIVDRAHQ